MRGRAPGEQAAATPAAPARQQAGARLNQSLATSVSPGSHASRQSAAAWEGNKASMGVSPLYSQQAAGSAWHTLEQRDHLGRCRAKCRSTAHPRGGQEGHTAPAWCSGAERALAWCVWRVFEWGGGQCIFSGGGRGERELDVPGSRKPRQTGQRLAMPSRTHLSVVVAVTRASKIG